MGENCWPSRGAAHPARKSQINGVAYALANRLELLNFFKLRINDKNSGEWKFNKWKEEAAAREQKIIYVFGYYSLVFYVFGELLKFAAVWLRSLYFM